MRSFVDVYRSLKDVEVKELLTKVIEDDEVIKRLDETSREDLDELLMLKMKEFANISEDDATSIFRKCMETILEANKIPFTDNIDDAAMFRLYSKHISGEILRYIDPIVEAALGVALSDGDYDEREKKLITSFIESLEIDANSKKEFINKIASLSQSVISKKCEINAVDVAKKFKDYSDEMKLSSMKLCYAVAYADGNLKALESKFLNKILSELYPNAEKMFNVKQDIKNTISKLMEENEDKGTNIFTCKEFVLSKVISNIASDILKNVGVFMLCGIVGVAIYWLYKLFRSKDITKLNYIFATMFFKAHKDKEQVEIKNAVNVFEKLSRETEDMLINCRTINEYINNINASYSDVAEQGWIKGVLGQLSDSNRKRINSGNVLLKELAHEVRGLLDKIMSHQKSLMQAIQEHIVLIAASQKLQELVNALAQQNKEFSEVILKARGVEELKAA